MSRLDSFIRRLEAQRACLNHAAELITSLPGNVLEFGLGNGRTYDHLRETLAGRDIYVFERKVAAHPGCIPPDDRLFLGDFLDSLPRAIAQLGQATALANMDIGTGDEAASRALARAMLPSVLRLLKPGGILISDQPVESVDLEALALPAGIKPGRYFLHRRRK
jgi:SAM-dependent methyltransferase